MLTSRAWIALIALSLIASGLGLALYKTLSMGFPLLPGEYREVWTIQSKVGLHPGEGPVEVHLKLPEGQAGWLLLDEHFASSGFGFSLLEQDGARRTRWTRAHLDRPATLYYKVQATRLRLDGLAPAPIVPVQSPLLEPDQQAAIDRLVDTLRGRSARLDDFVGSLLQVFARDSSDPDARFLLSTWEEEPYTAVLAVLAHAGFSARELRGIRLEDGRRRQTLSSLLEIHDGDDWQVFDPLDGAPGIPENFFVWQRGEGAVLDVVGASNSSLEFALVSNNLPARTLLSMGQRADEFDLLDFSIYSLPVEEQGVFKGLLLIPVAALVVVLMRVFVGVRTSGTFMPILIALAFIQTTLLVGLAIFVVLVSVGLWIRSWLSGMNLLLVARISAVVMVVILLMAALAIGSYKLGLEQVLTVTFFPTVILAWTIERMSILWEEEGGHEVLVQGGGSLLVAVLAYLAMSSRLVAHLTFNFPELTLCLLGIVLLLGKYTGYRLTELYRFRALGDDS